VEALLIVYYCLLTDPVCDRNTITSSSSYVDSCDKDYIEGVLHKLNEQHNVPPKYKLTRTECLTVDSR